MGKAIAESGDQAAALTEFQRALTLSPDLDEAHRLLGVALGRKGEEGEGFYHLGMASQLRGDLEQALSHFEHAETLLPEGSAHHAEVELALEELRPLVRERARERLERRRAGRRSFP